jgi:RNA polymerase sigma factor (sigma-70 family)
MMKMDEKEIIQRLKKGDRDAIRAIMHNYQHYVFTVARQIVRNHEMAEEITQDVFIRVYQKIHSYEERSKFSTWLFSIAYRIALNHLRKKQTAAVKMETVYRGDEIDERISIDEKPDGVLQEVLWKAIDSINQEQGVIISLFYLQEFSVQEISQIMGIPQNTVKIKLFRGRNNLRKVLSKNYNPGDLL